MRRLILVLCLGCASAPVQTAQRTPAGFNAERYPVLLDAIRRERPALISGRGGAVPRVIVNGIAEPFEALASIPTSAVLRVVRVMSDPTQHGSPTTLRVTLRVGNYAGEP